MSIDEIHWTMSNSQCNYRETQSRVFPKILQVTHEAIDKQVAKF